MKKYSLKVLKVPKVKKYSYQTLITRYGESQNETLSTTHSSKP